MDLMGRTRAVLSPMVLFVCDIYNYTFCILEHMYVHTHMLRTANQLIEKPKSVCSSEIHITTGLYIL